MIDLSEHPEVSKFFLSVLSRIVPGAQNLGSHGHHTRIGHFELDWRGQKFLHREVYYRVKEPIVVGQQEDESYDEGVGHC